MNTTIQLAIDLLYRAPLMDRLLEKGYKPQTLTFEKSSQFDSTCVLILQSHMWPELRHKLSPSTPVIMLGILSRFCYWFEAQRNFPTSFITFRDSPDDLFHSIDHVLRNNHYLSETVKNFILIEKKDRQEQLLGINLNCYLTQSELEVLALVGRGYTSSEIAEQRVRSIHTINTQRKRIRQKLDIINGKRLAVFAGRYTETFKTLISIEEEIELLEGFCKNTK